MIGRGGTLKLLSRKGTDRTTLFRTPFQDLLALDRQLVLDGEIAVPDEHGVTHIDALQDEVSAKRQDRLVFFAFDLLHLDGCDLRRCAIEDRKAVLRDLVDQTGCKQVVYLDHVIGDGDRLFELVRIAGAEGIVSKRLGQGYRGGEAPDWLKTECHETGRFTVIAFQELGEGRLESIHVGEDIEGTLVPAGQIRFGFAGRGWWADLNQLRAGPPVRGVVPLHPVRTALVKFFGRYKGGAIRDGVIIDLIESQGRMRVVEEVGSELVWGCDCDETIAAIDDRYRIGDAD